MQKWNKISFTELISDRTKDGIKLPTNEYNQSGLTAIIDQGQEFIAGYSDETEGAFIDVPAIIFGDHTRVFKYVDFPFFLGADGVKVLKANQEINYKYLYYYFLQAKFPNTGYARHFKWLKELQIPLPPLETQKNIAAVLDKCTALIAKHKLMLEKYDTLIKSRFIEMFGDIKEKEMIGVNAKLQGGYAFKSKDLTKEGVRLVQIGNVNKDNLTWDDIVYVPHSFLEKYSDYKLNEGDVVLAMTRPIIKSLNEVKIATVGKQDTNSLLNQRVGKFVLLNNKLNMCYLLYCCKTEEFKLYVEKMSGNSLQPNISSKQVEDYKIPVPPLELQQQFAAFVQQIDKSKFEMAIYEKLWYNY